MTIFYTEKDININDSLKSFKKQKINKNLSVYIREDYIMLDHYGHDTLIVFKRSTFEKLKKVKLPLKKNRLVGKRT